MRKAIIAYISIFLLSINVFAQDWYANGTGGNMSTTTWNSTSTGSCTASGGTTLTWASRSAGDAFHTNGCAGITIDVNPGVGGAAVILTNSASALSGGGTGTAGGTFNCATATGPATIDANVTAGGAGTAAVTITGSTVGNCNFGHNGGTVTSTGGSAASAAGITDSHTGVGLTHYLNITGGSNASAYGYTWNGSSGSNTINGVSTAATAPGYNQTGAGTATITTCVGSDTSAVAGCIATSTGSVTITGNLIFGKRAGPINGTTLYTPSATSCIMVPGASVWATTVSTCTNTDGTHQQFPSDSNIKTQSNVLNTITYGSYTGTATTGSSNSGSAH